MPKLLSISYFQSATFKNKRLKCISVRKFSQILKADLNDAGKIVQSESPQWKVSASIFLMRLPVVQRELNDIEKKYSELTEQIELEKSIYSPWEEEKLRQSKLSQQVLEGKLSPLKLDFSVTNQSIEDENTEKEAKFHEQLNEFESIENNDDMKRMNRHLDQTLALIIQTKLGNDLVWTLPSAEWEENETMKQCAEKALLEHCGLYAQYQATILSNSPSGFFKYKIPKEARKQCDLTGVKQFIFNTVVNKYDTIDLKGTSEELSIIENDSTLSHAWVTKEELKNYIKPKYYDVVKNLFL